MAGGIALTNRLAPEHCEVMTRNAEKVSAQITTAGKTALRAWAEAWRDTRDSVDSVLQGANA